MTEAQVTEALQKIEELESSVKKLKSCVEEVKRVQEERAVDFLTQEEYNIEEAEKYLLLVHGVKHTVNALYAMNRNGKLPCDTEKHQPIRYKRETLDAYAKRRLDYRNPEQPPVYTKELIAKTL